MALKSVGSESESESMTITSGSSGDGVLFVDSWLYFQMYVKEINSVSDPVNPNIY